MERRLKLTALDFERKVDLKQYRLRRDHKKGIRCVDPDERIRQQYFRVWVREKIHRQNRFALLNLAFMLEEHGVNFGVKGWFMDTRDSPFGVHGVVEGTKTQFKRFLSFMEDWKDEEVIDCYVRNKHGSYIENYTFDRLMYIEDPYTYHSNTMEVKNVDSVFDGILR